MVFFSGAIAANLNQEYIEKLRQIPTYNPPEWVHKMRRERKPLSELKPITVEELAQHKEGDDVWYEVHDN